MKRIRIGDTLHTEDGDLTITAIVPKAKVSVFVRQSMRRNETHFIIGSIADNASVGYFIGGARAPRSFD